MKRTVLSVIVLLCLLGGMLQMPTVAVAAVAEGTQNSEQNGLETPEVSLEVLRSLLIDPQAKVLIVIDAGHDAGYNQGILPGYTEGDWSYIQAVYDKQALENYGFDVIITRDASGNPGLYDRGQMAVRNSSGYAAVVFMSNHSNAYGADHNESASGVSAITSAHLSDNNRQLIECVLNAVAAEMNKTTGVTYNRGIEIRQNSSGADYYGVIRGSVSGATSTTQAAQGPVQYSFILEHGFHTNTAECAYLLKDSNRKAIAAAKARAFAEFFGKTGNQSGNSTQSNNNKKQTIPSLPAFNWNGTVTISDDTLNLRTAPDSDSSNVITELGNGARVTVLSEAANTKYGDLWYLVQAGELQGYVHSTWVIPDAVMGTGVASTWARVYADHGATPLQLYSMLGPGNRVVVMSEENGWYRVRIADRYVGYVSASQIALE